MLYIYNADILGFYFFLFDYIMIYYDFKEKKKESLTKTEKQRTICNASTCYYIPR